MPLIPPDTELLAGVELGGVPVATALSLATGIPAVYSENKPRRMTPPNSPKARRSTVDACSGSGPLGSEPLEALYRQVALPLAGEGVGGAWFAGRRAMAIDGICVDRLRDRRRPQELDDPSAIFIWTAPLPAKIAPRLT